MKPTLILTLALGLPTLATAHDFTAKDLEIQHPMAFETPVTAKSGAGYFIVNNTGKTDDTLLEVRADFPKVMLHKSEEKDGVATMMHVDKIDIPAGETIELAPGGFHVMFMGLDGDPLEEGEKIKATLVFEHAGEVEIEFNVEPRSKAAE
ncbi:copper chaperone PCu(A)C [uncultured Roseovarius sp.]|uniref:copper chaperone PCu(A)C n=1 Tax=uncultured Roseovarius sp. TaxID=293344 RepID=UPI00262F1360|nr:copper chaperone PCu(A)C [uncultured Roseovarius sp.]